MNVGIIIRFQIEGSHQWSDCDIKEVNYLKNEHRHIFYVRVKKIVSHENRDIEIISFKRKITDEFAGRFVRFGEMSCEMIAQKILEAYNLDYVEVLEDNENGGFVWKD